MSLSLWLVLCGAGALLMRPGLALYAAGMVRSKNSASIMLRGLIDIALATLGFWILGGAIVAAPAGHLLDWHQIGRLGHGDQSPLLFFALCATLISSGIAISASAERSRFLPLCLLSLLMGALVVPLSWRTIFWTDGYLNRWAFRDFAGASFIHLTGGVAALVTCILVGPRTGKYNRDGSSNAIPGHSLPLSSAGILFMFIAFPPAILGFVDSQQLANPAPMAINILVAAAGGTLASLIFSHVRYHKVDIHLVFTGLLGALVAISAAADVPHSWMALVIGAAAGIIVPFSAILLDLRFHIDDPTGAVGIHAIGAAWGLIAAGIFSMRPSLMGILRLVAKQAIGIVAIALLTAILAGALLFILKLTLGLRSREADEYDGLDLAEHDVGAYPDFQQTMIKSYHLREA